MKLPVASYTFLRNYANCPRTAHHLHVLRELPKEDPQPQAMRGGIQVHEAMEARLKKKKPLPESMEKWERFCKFDPHPIEAELKVAIRADGSPCQFFADDVWCRAKHIGPVINPEQTRVAGDAAGERGAPRTGIIDPGDNARDGEFV